MISTAKPISSDIEQVSSALSAAQIGPYSSCLHVLALFFLLFVFSLSNAFGLVESGPGIAADKTAKTEELSISSGYEAGTHESLRETKLWPRWNFFGLLSQFEWR
ncbi:hypothetical protein V8C42DRAFT_315949 [Trichoderma barbatum]